MSQQFVLIKPSAAGTTTLQNTDGTVRSLNPDHPTTPTTYHWETRPAGANGPYETCMIDGSLVAYNPLGTEPVIFPFKQNVPGGFSTLGIERLS